MDIIEKRIEDSIKEWISAGKDTRRYAFFNMLHDKLDESHLSRDACTMAENAHQGQFRISGEKYIEHPLRVAALYHLIQPGDTIGLSVCILHDVIEDSAITSHDIESFFGRAGKKISLMVDALSKRPSDQFSARNDRLKESYSRFLTASSIDHRVALIRMIDRFDNLKTVDILGPARALRILIETKNVLLPFFRSLRLPLVSQLDQICSEKLLAVTSNIINRNHTLFVKWGH